MSEQDDYLGGHEAFARAELTSAIRHELAEVLRQEAAKEPDPSVAQRLRDIAATFEASSVWR
jgi:hypothetical protein